jgi:hypothetical protein
LETTEKCPSCGEQMEHGYIISTDKLYWCDHVPLAMCRCGEHLDDSVFGFGCASLEGHRCKKCQIIRYVKKN